MQTNWQDYCQNHKKLLKALAVPPTGAQEIFPIAVSVLQYFYILVGLLSGGSILAAILNLLFTVFNDKTSLDLFFEVVFLALQGTLLTGMILLSIQGLRFRRGGISSPYPLIVLLLFQASIYFSNLLSTVRFLEDIYLLNIVLLGIVFLGGLGVSVMFIAFGWKDTYRWLPRRQAEISNMIERMFLLYTPKDTRILFLHGVFHLILLLAFIAPWFGAPFGPVAMMVVFCLCLSGSFLVLFPVHWLIRRYSK